MWFLKNELSQRIQRFLEVLWFVNQGKKQGKNHAHEFSTNLPSQKKERKKERKKKGQTDSVTESGHWGALRRRHSGQERSLGFPKHTFIQSLSQCRIKTLAPEHIVFERNTELPFHNRCTQPYCNPHNETLRNLFPSATHTYLKGFSWVHLHS